MDSFETGETSTGHADAGQAHTGQAGGIPIDTPPAEDGSRRRRGLLVGAVAATILLAVGAGGVVIATSLASSTAKSASNSAGQAVLPDQRVVPGDGRQGLDLRGTTQRASVTTGAVPATAAEKVGVVTIVSVLDFDRNSQAAGTGTVMTSSGLILTNNHVIAGATSIEVTVESTGVAHRAEVVGTDATDDIAVLKLAGASGLKTATYDSAQSVSAGDAISSVGNAEGTGELVTATGTVAATGQSITVQGESAGSSESLSNLIEVDSDVVSGDSGGPLLDAQGEVIGVVTAASSGIRSVVGYAIPISSALGIARQIESGQASATVTIGYPAFLGVQLAQGSASGATIGGVLAGTPAATLGLAAGDTITAVGSTPVASAADLSAAIAAHSPGDTVSIAWTDDAGASHAANVTLADGPAL
ncbi:PDZ domain-containing protein [Lacisediminihabitans profunda]|uniref:PDZ domain-containing protein n=2 Tax=Lacisediminihabitans profunda TaxID=2594790 RepID=A0A5C8UUM2_9MICO|nr:PDZ domain-containing protein [Lacisediminihabitans profunda]